MDMVIVPKKMYDYLNLRQVEIHEGHELTIFIENDDIIVWCKDCETRVLQLTEDEYYPEDNS